MTITTNQKKWLGIGVIAAAIYYAPSIASMARPQPAQRAQAAPPRTVLQPAPFHDLLGQYAGRANTARGTCTLSFELRENPGKAGLFAGYSSMTCFPVVRRGWYPYIGPRPTAAILTGSGDGDAIRFKVDDTVSGPCHPTAMTVKRFGSTGIALQFDDKCGGGKMLLSRSGR